MASWTDRSSDWSDAYLGALRARPPLSPAEVSRLAREIREQERVFRSALAEVPGAALRVVERWRELRWISRITACSIHQTA